MDTIRNVTQLQIGAKVALTAILDGVRIDDYTQLNDGEIVIVDNLNHKTDGSTTTPHLIKYIQRSGTNLIHSDIIDLRNGIRSYAITSAADETQQLDYVGYNGVSGEIDTLASNIYTIRLNILDKTTAGFMQQKIKEGFYKSNANAASYTQQAIALGLTKSLIANYSRETEQDIVFERVNSGAQANALGTSTVSVTNGSKFITTSESMIALILAGTILRFGATGAGAAPCYVCVGTDGGATTARVYELDVPWQGATDAAFIAASFESVTEGDWGVSLQGVDREFKAGYFWSNVNFWVTQIDFGELAGTALVTSTAAYPGIGVGNYIANLEGELQADEFIYRGFPEAGVVNRTDAEASNLGIYDVQVIEHEHNLKAAQGTPTESPKTLMIAWRLNAGGGGVNLNAAAVLAIQEALFTAANVTFTAQAVTDTIP
jgi:hypothetical protein